MPRNETLLSTIDDMILSMECTCGHRALLNVADVLPKLPEEATVHDVVDRARCRACGARGTDAVLYTRIVYDNLRAENLRAEREVDATAERIAMQPRRYSDDDGEATELDKQFFQEVRRGRPSPPEDQRDASQKRPDGSPQS